MKRFWIIFYLFVISACGHQDVVCRYWWIKNITDEPVHISIKQPLFGGWNKETVLSSGDSVLIQRKVDLEKSVVKEEYYFENDFTVDSISVISMKGDKGALFDRTRTHRIFRHSSWSFYKPVGNGYNFVWVYDLDNLDLIEVD